MGKGHHFQRRLICQREKRWTSDNQSLLIFNSTECPTFKGFVFSHEELTCHCLSLLLWFISQNYSFKPFILICTITYKWFNRWSVQVWYPKLFYRLLLWHSLFLVLVLLIFCKLLINGYILVCCCFGDDICHCLINGHQPICLRYQQNSILC